MDNWCSAALPRVPMSYQARGNEPGERSARYLLLTALPHFILLLVWTWEKRDGEIGKSTNGPEGPPCGRYR